MQEEPILVVSSDPTVISPIQDMLRNDYVLFVEHRTNKALQLFHDRHPILVIIDLDIPGLDGVALMRGLDLHPETPVAALLLRSDSSGREIGDCFDLGLTAFLKKPFNFYELKGLIKQSIDTKRIHSALKREKEYARGLIDGAIDMIVAVDSKRTIKEFNKAAEETFGYSAAEVIGHSVTMLYRDPAEGERLGRALRAQGHYIGEIMCRRKTGEIFPASLSAAILRDAGDRVIGTIGSSRDITEQKKIEEIKRAKEGAEIANQAKSAFLATMSHEIRSPMNAIIGMTDLALNTELTQEQRQYLQIVQQSADGLLCLLNDILDFSKIEVGKLELERMPFSIMELLEQTCDTLAVQAHNKNLELFWEVEPECPIHLEGDPMRLRQIIVNLVGNAIKFTKRGEVGVRVRLSRTDLPADLVAAQKFAAVAQFHFIVSDTGIGIPPEKQRLIFERFVQADISTPRTFGGAGLGLAISNHLTRLMGGQIWVESLPEQGSRFHFILPLGVRRDDFKAPHYTRLLQVFHRTILVAVENDALRGIISRQLTLWGFTVAHARSGEQILQTLSAAPDGGATAFDALILDCQLPDLMWINLNRWIGENPGWIARIIKIIPSSSRHRTVAGCMEINAAATLVKPSGPVALIQALNVAFGLTPPPDSLDRAPTIRRTTNPLKILLVDDDPGNLLTTSEMLHKAGHSVHTAKNGRECLLQLERERVDLVLMDIQMPEMDGLEATRIIRSGSQPAIDPKVPIMGVTAYALKGDRERCLESGMDDYLAKPFRIDELLEMTDQFAHRIGLTTQCGDRSVPRQEDPLVPSVTDADPSLRQYRLQFMELIVPILDGLKFALNGKDGRLAENYAQHLKDSAAKIGAARVKATAFRIVLAVRKQDFFRADSQMEILSQEFQELHGLLK